MIESYFNQVESPRAPRPPPPGVVSHEPPNLFEQESERGSRAKNSVCSVPSCKIRGFFPSVFIAVHPWSEFAPIRAIRVMWLVFDLQCSRGPVVIPRSAIRHPKSPCIPHPEFRAPHPEKGKRIQGNSREFKAPHNTMSLESPPQTPVPLALLPRRAVPLSMRIFAARVCPASCTPCNHLTL